MFHSHYAVHLVIYNVAGLPKVNRVDDFVVAIIFVAIEIFGLTSVSRIVKEQRIVRSRVLYQPVHCPQDIGLCGLTHRILLIIREDHHIFSLVAKVSIQICGHVFHVVDASSELASLAEVVDTDEKSLSSAGAVGILEGVARRSP